MNDQLVQNIETIVDKIFKQKEEADMRKETETALTNAAETITQLNASLEAKDETHKAEVSSLQETIDSLESQLSELSNDKKALEDEKAKLDEEKEQLTERAATAEKSLDDMRKDQLSKDRMEILTTAGIASTNKEAQCEKVRDMSEEDFASYKDELVSVRDFIVKELESKTDNSPDALAAAQAAQAKKDAEEEKAKQKVLIAARLEELKLVGADIVDEAEIAKIQKMDDEAFASFKDEVVASIDSDDVLDPIDPKRAIAAALNMEAEPNKDMVSKYRELGAAMADSIKSKATR